MSNCNEYSLRRVDGEWAVRFNEEVIATFADRSRGERLVRDLAQHLADLMRQPVRLVLAQDSRQLTELVAPGGLAGVFAPREQPRQSLH